jgi:PAS domain S-box-containing protein
MRAWIGRLALALALFCVPAPLMAQDPPLALAEAEEQEKTEQFLDSILRSAPSGIGVVENRVLVKVNDYIIALTGYSREELLGRSARMLYPSDAEYEFVGQEKYRQIAEKGTGTVETLWQHKDGALINVILSSTPLDLSDLDKGVVFTVLDISERYRAAAALESRTRQFIVGLGVFLVLQLSLILVLIKLLGDRKRMLSALKKKSDELEGYFSLALDLLCIADTKGNFVRVNKEWESVLGFTASELENKSFMDFVHPEDKDATLRAIARLNGQETVLGFINRYRCKDDSYRYLEWRAAPRGPLLYAVARDITERIRTEELLKSSEERFELAMLAVNEGIWDWHVRDDKVYFDRRYYTIAGYEPNEFPPEVEEWLARIHPEDRDRCQTAVDAHFRGETKVFDIDFRFLKKDGGWIWLRGRGRVVSRDGKGEVLRMVGTHTDITLQKNAEEQYRSLNESLEERIALRTRELNELNASLSKANEDLSTALRNLHETQSSLVESEKLAALGQLIAGIAHELNTPLGAIVSSNQSLAQILGRQLSSVAESLYLFSPEIKAWFGPALARCLARSNTLEEAGSTHRKRKLLTAALKACGMSVSDTALDAILELQLQDDPSIMTLIRDCPEFEQALAALNTLASIKYISDVIALAADKSANVVSALLYYVRQDGDEHRVSVDLAKELDSLLTLYTNKIKYDVRLERSYESGATVMGDRNKLNQVWLNLMQNALQAMDYRGELSLGIAREGELIKVSVADSGPGIPEHLRDRVFEPFFTTKKHGEGTGLGLDLCRKIVEKHGGSIAFESRPGRTVFTVSLPAAGGLG